MLQFGVDIDLDIAHFGLEFLDAGAVAGQAGDYALGAQPSVASVTRQITPAPLAASASINGADKADTLIGQKAPDRPDLEFEIRTTPPGHGCAIPGQPVGEQQDMAAFFLHDRLECIRQLLREKPGTLGEFEQGRPLMERLRELHPEYKILLTFFSPSGYEVRKDYKGADSVCYLPLDTIRN